MSIRISTSLRFLVAAIVLFSLAACDGTPVDEYADEIRSGEWGAEDLGVLVSESMVHVHVGCTFGNFPAPVALDDFGRFNIAGEYFLYAFPVATEPAMAARLTGQVRGNRLTFTVSVNDTVAKDLVVLGPSTVVFGEEAVMSACPICENPSTE